MHCMKVRLISSNMHMYKEGTKHMHGVKYDGTVHCG